jgi:surface protein
MSTTIDNLICLNSLTLRTTKITQFQLNEILALIPTFTTTWDISTVNTITLPLPDPTLFSTAYPGVTVYDFTVDWGDNTYSLITSSNWNTALTHTYQSTSPTPITVKIQGTLRSWSFAYNPTSASQLLTVQQWGCLKLINIPDATGAFFNYINNGNFSSNFSPNIITYANFYNCVNLTLDNVSDVLDLSTINTMCGLFSNCINIITIANVKQWNTSSVTDFSCLFSMPTVINIYQNNSSAISNQSSSNFNTSISGWNISNVVFDGVSNFGMASMFNGANSYNNGNESLYWSGTSSLPNSFNSMFQYCSNFNVALVNWDTSNVSDMSYMFGSASSFNQPIGSWNTSNVTDMTYMFYSASSFNQPIGSWITSKVQSMSAMFLYAGSFNQNISSWDVSHVLRLSSMFAYASSFNNGSLTNDNANPLTWNTNSVISIRSMFFGAVSFNQDISSFNVSNITNTIGFFRLFHNAILFNQNLNSWDVSNITLMNYAFAGACSFNNGDEPGQSNIPLKWNTGKVSSFDCMFYGASVFNQKLQDASGNNGWDISSVVCSNTYYNSVGSSSPIYGFNNMFSNTSSFNNGGHTLTFNIVTPTTPPNKFSICGMFSYATAFNQEINIDTSNVIDMSYMFAGANLFNQSLASWNISSIVTNSPITNFNDGGMHSMFTASGMSSTNYGLTLIGWAGESGIPHGLTLGSNTNTRPTSPSAAYTAEQNLITNYKWTIVYETLSETVRQVPPFTNYYTGPQLAKIYNYPTPSSEQVVVGVFGGFPGGLYGDFDANGVMIKNVNSDVYKTLQLYGIAEENWPTVIVKTFNQQSGNMGNTYNNPPGFCTTEHTQDVIAIASTCASNKLVIILYLFPVNIDFYEAYNEILTNKVNGYPIPTIISSSFLGAENTWSVDDMNKTNELFRKATSGQLTGKPVNIINSSGDFGAFGLLGGSVSACFPSSSPYVTSVGGTDVFCPTLSYDSTTIECVWNFQDTGPAASGGGVSQIFSIPSYQVGISGLASTTMRNVPDVSLPANLAMTVYLAGSLNNANGTSLSSPLFAGYLACCNVNYFVNPKLYKISKNAELYASCFHDIVLGNDIAIQGVTIYVSQVGYDNCTGLGSINGVNLLNAMNAN